MKCFLRRLLPCVLLLASGVLWAEEEEAPEATQAAAQAGAAPAPAQDGPPMPQAVAKVGNHVITGAEFQRDLALRLRQAARRGAQPAEPDLRFRQETLQERIDALVLQQLAESVAPVDDAAVEREFKRGLDGFPSRERFQEYLKMAGLDEDSLKRQIRARLTVEKFKEQKTGHLTVADDAVREQYDRWARSGQLNRSGRTADLMHLMVVIKGTEQADRDHALGIVRAARERILAGESFEALAREFSEEPPVRRTGGRYVEVSAQGMPDYIAERMFVQPVGELPEPFEAAGAWHLLRVDAVNEPGVVPFEKAAERIRGVMLERDRTEALAKLIDSAKLLMDITIYKAELDTKRPPSTPPTAPPPPELSRKEAS
ncbi:MAG: hypothetical protein GX580_16660 [Candidatus Hydrogenedens sp.]|nr:peptidylprolyl isomerase [Candidatus Hydrogenedentota bacterium]NLF59263.1 hypothetical protein [Candidatus Hydrogenedens sp.]